MSHFENEIDGASFLTILGQDKNEWISLSFFRVGNTDVTNLWVKTGETWSKILKVERFWLNFWIHTCLVVDSGKFSVTVTVFVLLYFRFQFTI